MPRLAKPTILYTEGGLTLKRRVHLDKAYSAKDGQSPIERDLRLDSDTLAEFDREELTYRALYLRALSRMFAEQNYNASAELMFPQPGKRSDISSFGSQSHLVLVDFSTGKSEGFGPGFNESTLKNHPAKYGFLYKREHEGDFAGFVSYYAWDSRAVAALESHGASHDAMKDLGKDFLALAAPSEHDYVHQLIDANATGLARHDVVFNLPGTAGAPEMAERKKGKTTTSGLEDYTLSLNAQVLHRLFEELPKRKEAYLALAVKTYGELAAIQKKALQGCNGDAEQEARVNEAVTSIADTIGHRIFRVISPDDAGLRTPPNGGPSVAKALNDLTLVTRDDLLTPERGPKPADNLALLDRHCSDWLGETYREIHKPESTFLVRITKDGKMETAELSALEVLARMNELSAVLHSDPQAYFRKNKEYADKTREAMALRKPKEDGSSPGAADMSKAARIERELQRSALPQANAWSR